MPTSALHDANPSIRAGESAEEPDTAEEPIDPVNAGAEADESNIEDGGGQDAGEPRRSRWRMTPPQLAVVVGLTMAVLLGVLIGFLGLRVHDSQRSAELRASYLQAGRQGAVNLTTIDWHHADADVQRILAAATGNFYDDFAQRSQPFVDVVKKVQSVSTGTVTVAGLESSTDKDAQVLVAVSVQTATADAPPTSRAWRMRVAVQKVGNDMKVSNVEFVP